MDIQELGAIGELVGGVAVIATLIYLAVQVKQSTAAMRSVTHQTQVDSQVAVNSSIANDPALAALIAKANEDYSVLEPSEEIRLQFLFINYFNLWHSGFWNHRDQLLPEHAWVLWDNGMAMVLHSQMASRQVWITVDRMYDAEFRRHVDAAIERLGLVAKSATGTLDSGGIGIQ